MDVNVSGHTINIQEVCRLCLSVDAFRLPIFHDSLDKQVSVTLSERIFACLNIKVSLNDSLSHLICHRCLYKVDEFYQFKINCLKSDVLLNEGKKRSSPSIENTSDVIWEENTVDQKPLITPEMFHPPEVEPQVNNSSTEAEENPDERQDSEISQPCLAPSNLVVALLEDEENAGPNAEAPFPQDRVEGNPWYDRSNCEMEKPYQISNSDVSSQSTLKAFNFRNPTPPCKTKSTKKRKSSENSVRSSSKSSAVKKYSCNHCTMSFNFRSNLLRHERVHSGERPFKCTICSKSFSQNEHLVRHDRVHSKANQVLASYQGQEL